MAKAPETTADKKAQSAHLSSQGKLPPKPITGKTKMVVATDRGYYNYLREEGDVFEVPAHFKGSWFKDADKNGKPVGEDEDEELV